MALTKFGTYEASTSGNLPSIGSAAADFTLTANNMKDLSLKDFVGKNVVLNIFPSVDTSTCATSVREFNKRVTSIDNTVVLCISKDLPMAQKRFCGAEGIDKPSHFPIFATEVLERPMVWNCWTAVLPTCLRGR